MNLKSALTLLGETAENIAFMPIEFYEYLTSSTLQMALRMRAAAKSPTLTAADRQRANEVAKRAIPVFKAYRAVRNHLRQQQ